MTTDDRRLIEDYLPVSWLSGESSGEPRTKGHISTLHLWRARRPLVACRAAVYSALVQAPGSVRERDDEEQFLKRLCQWGASPDIVEEARRRIAANYGEVTPRVLDCFAGGGAIPLEALRLGCESYALDLNPVAYLILKATCEYPQRYGASLGKEVRQWAERVAERVRVATADFYPKISMPDSILKAAPQKALSETSELPQTLTPFVFLWARTVICPNPQCRAVVPLYGQTWLRKKKTG